MQSKIQTWIYTLTHPSHAKLFNNLCMIQDHKTFNTLATDTYHKTLAIDIASYPGLPNPRENKERERPGYKATTDTHTIICSRYTTRTSRNPFWNRRTSNLASEVGSPTLVLLSSPAPSQSLVLRWAHGCMGLRLAEPLELEAVALLARLPVSLPPSQSGPMPASTSSFSWVARKE